MKSRHILTLTTLLGALLLCTPAFGQEEFTEVRGYCEDAVTKQPLAGIMVNALNDKRFTAMTEENGEFVIKVPTFVTALYIHAPQYLSQQVGLGKSGSKVQVYLLPGILLCQLDFHAEARVFHGKE